LIGKPFAFSIFMAPVIIRMKVLSGNHMELSQTIASLIGSVRTEKGGKGGDLREEADNGIHKYF
jgi:hypothetical protein